MSIKDTWILEKDMSATMPLGSGLVYWSLLVAETLCVSTRSLRGSGSLFPLTYLRSEA